MYGFQIDNHTGIEGGLSLSRTLLIDSEVERISVINDFIDTKANVFILSSDEGDMIAVIDG